MQTGRQISFLLPAICSGHYNGFRMSNSESNQSSFAFHTGRSVGKYRLESFIGRGGMAEVYRSTHPELGRPLAVKILHPFHTDIVGFVERFRQEAQAIAALRHPHIVQVYDFSESEDGLHFMVMEYIDGMSLDVYLSEHPGPLPMPQAMTLFRQVAEALHAAHEKGIIHRDVKPSNILIDRQGTAYLTDFGIAQILGAQRLTMSYMSPGTPSFMAPEQGTGQPITRAVDLYALGGLLYQLLTGRLPYEDDNPLAVIMRKSAQPPAPPSLFNPTLTPEVDAVILQAMALHPAQRFENALIMIKALERALARDSAKIGSSADPLETAVIPQWTLNKPELTHYEIRDLISENAYLQRFAARSTALEQPCFLDVLRTPAQDAPDLAAQFRQHWQGLSQLNHPHLAAVTNVDLSLDNRPFVAFEHVEGVPLDKQLALGQPFPPEAALRLVRHIAKALAAAQEVGMVHQDLRPEQILLRDGNMPILVGLGGPVAFAAQGNLYAAPEQERGLPVSARSNMYSLGILLYELLSGQQVSKPGPELNKLPADFSGEMRAVLRVCLQPAPAQRPASWAAFLDLVDAALGEKQEATEKKAERPFWQPVAAVMAVVAVALGAIWVWQSSQPSPAEEALSEMTARAETAVTPFAGTPPTLPPTTAAAAVESGDFTITGPSPYRAFAPDETVVFAWVWPDNLAVGQQFVVYMTGRYGRFPVGMVTQASTPGQYELALPARELAGEPGAYEWQVVLETAASGGQVAASELLPLNLVGETDDSGGRGSSALPTVDTGVRISQVSYNPPGEDLDGEFVLITNEGTDAVDLTGWLLQDDARSPHVFTFPPLTLAPETAVQVWTGSGQNDAANLYWAFGSPVWNNDGDTVTLLTNSGDVAAQCAYPGGDEVFDCP